MDVSDDIEKIVCEAERLMDEAECFFSETSPFIGQWKRLLQLSSSVSNSTELNTKLDNYKQRFSSCLQFREIFCNTVEIIMWHKIDTSKFAFGDANMTKAQDIIQKFLEVLQSMECVAHSTAWMEELQGRLQLKPLEFVREMKSMILTEQEILELPLPECHFASFQKRLTDIQEQLHSTEFYAQTLSKSNGCLNRQSQNCGFSFYNQDDQSPCGQIPESSPFNMEFEDSTMKAEIIIIHESLTLKLRNLLNQVRNELNSCWRWQACTSNGLSIPLLEEVTKVENCCQQLFQLLSYCIENLARICKEVNACSFLYDADTISSCERMWQEYDNIAKELIASCVLIEEHPPQLLKIGTPFKCRLRHLLPYCFVSNTFGKISVSVHLVSVDLACKLSNPSTPISERDAAGQISAGAISLQNNPETSSQTITWEKMKVMNVTRAPVNKNHKDSVLDEEFRIAFCATIEFHGNCKEYSVESRVFSLPISITCAKRQEKRAEAVIFWRNAGSPFNIPHSLDSAQSLPLCVLLENLNAYWIKHCRTNTYVGRGLDEDAKNFLVSKLFGNDKPDPLTQVSWDVIIKAHLPGKKFTFWDYFYQILDLVSSENLKDAWNAGLIRGFIEREECENLLSKCEAGTFLLRFSQYLIGNKNQGGLTLSFSSIDITGRMEFSHYNPETKDDLKSCTHLHNAIIKDRSLKWLYPKQLKTVFCGLGTGKDGKPLSVSIKGYVKRHQSCQCAQYNAAINH